MALSSDIEVLRVGAEGVTEPVAAPLLSGVTVYSGSIALLASGVLKNAASPASTDTCIGLIGGPTGGTYTKTGPGIVGAGTTNATAVWVDCLRGIFLLASGTGADTIAATDAGKTVYVIDEQTVGLTSASNTRPVAGVCLPADPTTPTGFVPVKIANPGS
jgi:hypothetical protein